MTELDSTTLFLAGGLVIVVCGIAFVLETLLRRNDTVGRLWSVFFIGAMFAVFSYIVGSLDPRAWWALASGNGTFAAAVGFIWCGARKANGKNPLLVVPLLTGALVTGAALLPGPAGGVWAGAMEMFVGVAVVTALGAFESFTGRLGRSPSARILAIMLLAMSVYYAARAVLIAVLGPEDAVFSMYFGSEASTLFEICLATLATVTLSSIQSDRFRRLSDLDADSGMRVQVDGIVGAHAFRELAESWLLRSLRERSTLVLLLVDVADLSEINVAFGRAAGDAAIRATGRIALSHAPAATLVGHVSPRRFALLMAPPTNDSVEAIADRIRDSVLTAPIDELDRFRSSTYRGIATTRTAGVRFDDLLREAAEDVLLDIEVTHAAAVGEG